MTKPKTGCFYTLKFYDHGEYAGVNYDPIVLEIYKGKLAREDEQYYHFDLVGCNQDNNVSGWKVLKADIISIKRKRR
jgi:hypothetical protein